MCLAVPGKVLEVRGEKAIVDFGGIKREVMVSFLDDVRTGDYVIVHVGFAIQKLTAEEAAEAIKDLKQIIS